MAAAPRLRHCCWIRGVRRLRSSAADAATGLAIRPRRCWSGCTLPGRAPIAQTFMVRRRWKQTGDICGFGLTWRDEMNDEKRFHEGARRDDGYHYEGSHHEGLRG